MHSSRFLESPQHWNTMVSSVDGGPSRCGPRAGSAPSSFWSAELAHLPRHACCLVLKLTDASARRPGRINERVLPITPSWGGPPDRRSFRSGFLWWLGLADQRKKEKKKKEGNRSNPGPENQDKYLSSSSQNKWFMGRSNRGLDGLVQAPVADWWCILKAVAESNKGQIRADVNGGWVEVDEGRWSSRTVLDHQTITERYLIQDAA